MAAGLPVVSPDVGDVAAMVAAENRSFVATTEAAFRAALARMTDDAALRIAIGAANRQVAAEHFDEETMVDAYERSEEHTSELQSLMRNSYAVFCLKKKTIHEHNTKNRNKRCS